MITTNLGQVGIIKDTPPHLLPPNAWSDGQNVRMYEGAVEKFLGHDDSFENNSAQSVVIDPYFTVPIISGTNAFWVYAGLNQVYATNGTTHENITRASGNYSTDSNKSWTGGVIGGVLYLNNAVDAPQQWTVPADLNSPLTDLSNWPTDATCESLRVFKHFLIALNYTNGSGTNFNKLVKWSHSTSFNSVPSSWDETDATLDAGEYELADTPGRVIDGSELRDAFIIYKEDSIWAARFVGAPFIFSFYKISEITGALNKNCIAEFPGGHFVLGKNDCYINDGQTIQSVLDGRWQRELFNNLNATEYTKTYVVPNYQKKEMWVCYPTGANVYPNTALVWNWGTNAISVRDIPSAAHITFGVSQTVISQWDEAGDWDSDSEEWGQGLNYDNTRDDMIISVPSERNIYVGDSTNTFNGTNMTASITRESLFYDSIGTYKFCSGVDINMEGDGPVDIYVGRQEGPNASTTWEGPFEFDPATDHKIDCRVTGRMLGFRVTSSTDISWRLISYDMKVAPAGMN
jgi:hypothetical protein